MYQNRYIYPIKNNNNYFDFKKTPASLDSFFKLVKKDVNNKHLISFINFAQRELDKNAKNRNWTFIRNNLRMTSLEI